MSLREKLAQLVGLWAAAKRSDEAVAPMQDQLLADTTNFTQFAVDGLGQFTRHYGTRPIDATSGAVELASRQRWLMKNTRAGIPAIVHEECLTGVLASGATTYPIPLAWGATFNPALVTTMAEHIGRDLASLGVHQGLAPVLDVIRDVRWGRVEECISEDPTVVGTLGAAYVAGIESTGRVATLKHFVGYSASRGGQNHGPVSVGRRELAEVFLPPFEQAIREGGARSVMNSYTELDGVPVASDAELFTTLLRDGWGFEGTVVADYFAVTFLQTMHLIADDLASAATLAITAGIDVELPTGSAYLEPLERAVASGAVSVDIIDRALVRVLNQKEQLGLLDDDYAPELQGPIELNSAANRAVARELAEQSIVLLSNDGTLPLSAAPPARVAIIGPNARSVTGLSGCYSFANHVLPHHPDARPAVAVTTIAEALIEELSQLDPEAFFVESRGCDISSAQCENIAEAVRAASAAEIVCVVVGDQSGMFGRGTSGEGCDAADLQLPGVQRELVEAVLSTGVPTILVLVTGRPYILDGLVDRAAAVVQAFLPGDEGAGAIARVLSGRVNPSGRLPVGLPSATSTQPSGYLHPKLGGKTAVSTADPTPSFPFGWGLSYATFEYSELRSAQTEVAVDGEVEISFTLRNSGDRDGIEIVQLYAHDPVASVTRPLRQLVAFERVAVAAGQAVRVTIRVSNRAFALIDRDYRRVVEPGEIQLILARDAGSECARFAVQLRGDVAVVPLALSSDRSVTVAAL